VETSYVGKSLDRSALPDVSQPFAEHRRTHAGHIFPETAARRLSVGPTTKNDSGNDDPVSGLSATVLAQAVPNARR
jgi:hypothetical protein